MLVYFRDLIFEYNLFINCILTYCKIQESVRVNYERDKNENY